MLKKRRGLADMVGGVFIIIIISAAIVYTVYSMEQITQATETVEIKQTTDFQKTTEEFKIVKIEKANQQFNMTVTNNGDIPVHLTRLWVENTTDSAWPMAKYDLDVAILPGYSATDIGQDIGLTALDTQSYQLKLVSERGNTENLFLNSVNNDSVYLNLRATPTKISTGFSATLVLEVINTGTNKLVDLQAEMVGAPAPSCAVECSYELVTGPTPTSFESLDPGDIATFEWVYTIEGETDGDNYTFTARLVDGDDTVTANVAVKIVETAQNVSVSLQSLGAAAEALVEKSILVFHVEQNNVPNGGYQLMSVEPDGGTDGTRLPTSSGGGSITHQSTVVTNVSTASNPTTINLSSASTGDLRIVTLSGTDASSDPMHTMTIPSGWTEINNNQEYGTSSAVRAATFYRVVQSGDASTVDVTWASASSVTAISNTYSGIDTSDPIDVEETTFAVKNGQDPVSRAVTTTTENTMVVRTFHQDDADEASSVCPIGLTERGYGEMTLYDTNGVIVSSCETIQAGIGSTGTATWQTTDNEHNLVQTFAIKSAANVSLDPFPTPLSFMTTNGSNTVTVPAGAWNATLWIDSATNPIQAVSSNAPDIKYHMEDGDGVNPDNSRVSSTSTDLQACAVSGAWCNLGSTICDGNWDNRFAITVDNTQVSGSSNLSNFPMLVHITGTDFTNNLDDADDSINDIRFTSDAGVLLDYEIEKFSQADDELVAWVEVPTLDYNDDTVIYMYFDNALTSGYGDEQNVEGTWDADFHMVHHLNEIGTGTDDFKDSTQYNHDGTKAGTDITLGVDARIGDGIDTDASQSGTDGGIRIDNDIADLFPAFTISMWINPDSERNNNNAMGTYPTGGAAPWFLFRTLGTPGDQMDFHDDVGENRGTDNTIDATWQYVTVTWSSGTQYDWYLNGATNGGASGVQVDATNNDLYIGRLPDGGNNFGWVGLLDEVRISDVVRSNGWIFTEYNNMNAPNTFYSLTVQSTGGGVPPDWQDGQGPHSSGANYYDGVSSCHKLVGDVLNSSWDVAGNDAATSLWFKTNGAVPVSTEQMLVYYEGAGTYPNTDYYKISLVEQGKVLYEFDANQGSGTTTCKTTLDTYDDGSWYNAIGVRDESDNSCDLYVYDITGTLKPGESVVAGTQTGTGETIAVNAGDKMYVGSRTEIDDFFDGWIDDVFHWNTVELDSTAAQALARVNHGTAAHKFDVSIDIHDTNGVWLRNEYTSTDEIIPYHDPKHFAPTTNDNALGKYNITMSGVPAITVDSTERLNFTMAFKPASGTWQDMRMGIKLDDTTLSPQPSFLHIPTPDNPFASYVRYDKTAPLEMFIENIGEDGVYYVYSGTRVSFDNGTHSYASLIDSVNGTSPSSWTVDMTHDSLYIAPGEVAHMYFYAEPSDHPCQDVGSDCVQNNPDAMIIPDGTWRMAAWINGYTNMGESFGRSVLLGSADVS